jgi:hypothetical protein
MWTHECVDEGLGQSSYLVDLDDGTAQTVDSLQSPIAHEQPADGLGRSMASTIDAHSCADSVTGIAVPRRRGVHVQPGGIEPRDVAPPRYGGSLMVGTVGRSGSCGPHLAVPAARGLTRGLRRFDQLPRRRGRLSDPWCRVVLLGARRRPRHVGGGDRRPLTVGP